MNQAVHQKQAERAHRITVNRSISEMAKFLQDSLGTGLLMYLVDVKDPKTIARWANGQVDSIRNLGVERRLRATNQIVEILLEIDSARTIRGWFLGMDPTLDDESPADVIREGRLADALGAAVSYVSVNG
ncbi:hypothetical protein BH09CHL1_BH09CHL1_25750 [soil metagenome]